jgi:hypothetical protein
MAAARETRLCCPPLGYKHAVSITQDYYIGLLKYYFHCPVFQTKYNVLAARAVSNDR